MANEQTTIYFNPKCSKCNMTLALLKEKGKTPEVIEYLQTTPSKDELKNILSLLSLNADQLLRKHENAYQEAGLSDASSEDDILNAMMNHPILIERPIVVHNGKAVIGRPPENILEIL
ncbi:MAG: arsenate reductase (glutaredoxin) [Gammaproteobacteria bacterium]